MVDLITLFRLLSPPDNTNNDDTHFWAIPIPGYESHRLAVDYNKYPALLISTTNSSTELSSTPIILEHLTVNNNIPCRIHRMDGVLENASFAILKCTSTDKILQDYFLQIANSFITVLGTNPSSSDVATAVNQAVELFSAMREAPRKSIQGLWAELLLIAQSRDPLYMVSAWHATPEDRYDFNAKDQRIEVKSAKGHKRIHHFSLEQLYPPAGTTLLVASILVERVGVGVSVVDLVEEIKPRLSNKPEYLLRIDQIVSQTLGETWRDAVTVQFDRKLAEDSLAFFDAVNIPKIGPHLPDGVSEVHFKADLTGKPTARLIDYRSIGELYKVAL